MRPTLHTHRVPCHVCFRVRAQVSRFLNSRHADKYMVFNLSERKYDPSHFDYRVLDAGFPDHFAPPLDLAWAVCSSMHAWLSVDPQNVVAVHCKAGKVRECIGLLLCVHVRVCIVHVHCVVCGMCVGVFVRCMCECACVVTVSSCGSFCASHPLNMCLCVGRLCSL